MESLLEVISQVIEESTKSSRASNKIAETATPIAIHLMMVHHNPPENRTKNYWASEISAHLKTAFRHADKISHSKILDSLLSSGIASPYTYETMHSKIVKEKPDVKFLSPSNERHGMVLDDINRFAKELSNGNLPKVLLDNESNEL